MIRSCFAAEEQEEWQRLPKSVQPRAFFTGWTRKEAILKATGQGLARPLGSFAVTMSPDKPPLLLRLDNDTTVGRQWTIADLPGSSELAAAVAVPSRESRLRVRKLPPEWIGFYGHEVDRDPSRTSGHLYQNDQPGSEPPLGSNGTWPRVGPCLQSEL
jgi:hypothetical protein